MLFCTHLEEYAAEKPLTERKYLLIAITRIACFLETIRFPVSEMFQKFPTVQYVCCNFSYLMGDHFFSSSWLFNMALVITSVSLVIAYQEVNQMLHILKIWHLILTKRIAYPLNRSNEEKLAFKLNLLLKYLMDLTFEISVFIQFGACFLFSIIAYFDTKTDYSLIMTILWTVIMFVFTVQTMAILWAGVIFWYASTLYLKLKFREINAKIERSLTSGDVNQLLRAINEHNFVGQITSDFNKFFSKMIFIIYYLATPGFQIALFGTHKPDTSLLGRVIYGLVTGFCFAAVMQMNVMSTWISKEAHKSYPLLYAFLIRRRFDLTKRLKVEWWTRMYDLLCYDEIGNRVQISDQKLATIHKKCVDDRHSLSYGLHKRDDDSYPDDHHNDPILSCTNAKIESQRDLLNAFCDAKTFSCIKQKPLFDSVLDSGSDSTALKQQLVKRFDGIAEVLCNDKQQISDDQLAQLETKCGSNNTTTELTDRQKVLSLCGTQKACIVDNWVKKFDSAKSEECKKFCDMGDKYI
ncbi:unnamed protein product, partial [Medioppia subpectinata]